MQNTCNQIGQVGFTHYSIWLNPSLHFYAVAFQHVLAKSADLKPPLDLLLEQDPYRNNTSEVPSSIASTTKTTHISSWWDIDDDEWSFCPTAKWAKWFSMKKNKQTIQCWKSHNINQWIYQKQLLPYEHTGKTLHPPHIHSGTHVIRPHLTLFIKAIILKYSMVWMNCI